MVSYTPFHRLRIFLLNLILSVFLYLTAVAFLPGIPPHETFETYTLTPAMQIDGILTPNNILDKAELIIDGGIADGAESIAVQGDDIFYAGLGDGTIIKYDNGTISTVAKTGGDCGASKPQVCGRPLGLRLEPSGNLLVADAFCGLLSVNTKTGHVEKLFPYDEPIEGVVPRLADDLDVAQDGTIYWSDASSKFNLWEGALDFLVNTRNGRLLKWDPKTKRNTVLIPDIGFANGVQLSRNEEFVLVVETKNCRVLRFYLKGAKAGTYDVFVDGLPGLPDNIRPNGKGGFYISLVSSRKSVERLGPLGALQKVENGIMVVEVGENGSVIGSLQSKTSEMAFITQFTLSGNYAYLGSFKVPQVWRIKTSDLNLK